MDNRIHRETLIKFGFKFGFKFGKNGAHSSRTMMLAELQLLFSVTSVSASLEQGEFK